MLNPDPIQFEVHKMWVNGSSQRNLDHLEWELHTLLKSLASRLILHQLLSTQSSFCMHVNPKIFYVWWPLWYIPEVFFIHHDFIIHTHMSNTSRNFKFQPSMIPQKVCGLWPNSDLYAPAPKTTHELGGNELGPIEAVHTVNLSIQPFLGCYEV